jgi:hypothetical protein
MASGSGGFDLASLELSIDAEGQWRHEGVVVTHDRVVGLLFRSLQKMGDGYFVCTEGLCLPVAVADCPLVVTAVRHEPEAVMLSLSNGDTTPLAPATLTVDAQSVPRCVVRDDGMTARFSRAAWLQLAEAIDESEDGFVLRAGDESHPVMLVD